MSQKNRKKIIKVKLIKNNEKNTHNEITENSNENRNKHKININIHPNFNNYLLKDINYIKSTTIKEILKTLKIDGGTFKKLESHLNKEIKII
jgi:hypothetical protein